MANQQIIEYFRANAQYSREELRVQLKQTGYQDVDIAAAEAVVDGVPPPPSPGSNVHGSVAPIPVRVVGERKLHPRAVWRFFFTYLNRWWFIGLYLAVSIVSNFSSGDSGTLSGIIFFFIVATVIVIGGAYGWAVLAYRFYKFELTDAAFKKELGVIRKKYVTIPYDRIQNIDMHRGIIDRLLGITGLDLQTAGSSGSSSRRRGMFRGEAEGYIPGLAHEDAEALREEIMSHVKETSGHGV